MDPNELQVLSQVFHLLSSEPFWRFLSLGRTGHSICSSCIFIVFGMSSGIYKTQVGCKPWVLFTMTNGSPALSMGTLIMLHSTTKLDNLSFKVPEQRKTTRLDLFETQNKEATKGIAPRSKKLLTAPVAWTLLGAKGIATSSSDARNCPKGGLSHTLTFTSRPLKPANQPIGSTKGVLAMSGFIVLVCVLSESEKVRILKGLGSLQMLRHLDELSNIV